MTIIQKPRVEFQLDIPEWEADTKFVTFHPQVIDLKWTKNHHLAADELTVTLPYMEAGVDPRMIKHARCAMWMWDAQSQTFSPEDHIRFTGIATKATRRLTEQGWVVDMTFHDYTTLFLKMKPYPSSGAPEWSDTLRSAWAKICDHTGHRDPTSPTGIRSSVAALREAITFDPPELGDIPLGTAVSPRFHALAKPQPKTQSDAWGVWQWLVGSLGLVSFITRDECIVTNSSELFKEEHAPLLIYGHHIDEFEEVADTEISNKGILLKSFDPLKGVLLESRWPPPEDESIKKSRAVAKRALKEGRDPTLNETSAEYMEFEYHDIHDQATLDARCREAYEQFSRQEIKGKIRTPLMFLESPSRSRVDILGLSAGDCIYVGIDQRARDAIKNTESEDEKVRRLVAACGYIPEVARLVARNLAHRALATPLFHVETLEVELTPERFSVNIGYHNKVFLSGTYD